MEVPFSESGRGYPPPHPSFPSHPGLHPVCVCLNLVAAHQTGNGGFPEVCITPALRKGTLCALWATGHLHPPSHRRACRRTPLAPKELGPLGWGSVAHLPSFPLSRKSRLLDLREPGFFLRSVTPPGPGKVGGCVAHPPPPPPGGRGYRYPPAPLRPAEGRKNSFLVFFLCENFFGPLFRGLPAPPPVGGGRTDEPPGLVPAVLPLGSYKEGWREHCRAQYQRYLVWRGRGCWVGCIGSRSLPNTQKASDASPSTLLFSNSPSFCFFSSFIFSLHF